MSQPLLLRLFSVIGASASFYLLLSVVPLYAQHAVGGSAAGLATGALMAATVLGELTAPWFITRWGHRWVLAVGLFLLGAPALVLTTSGSMLWIITICVVRGLGFAATVVAGGALTAMLIPAERRGEGLALVGFVSNVPSLAALPLGVWLASAVGFGAVSIAAAVVALLAIAAVPGLPEPRRPAALDDADESLGSTGYESDRHDDSAGRQLGIAAGFRSPPLARPTAVFAATALGAGIIVTFLPLVVGAASTALISSALFVQPAATTAAAWVTGRVGDRRGSGGLILPGLVVSATGMAVMALVPAPAAVIAGVALFGVGFGIAQNATLTLMYERVSTAGYGTVTALWNFAYDAGMGFGALGFGWLTATVSYRAAFLVTACTMLVAVIPAFRDRRAQPALSR